MFQAISHDVIEEVLAYVHDKDALRLAAASASIRKAVLTICNSQNGPVELLKHIPVSKLWRHFSLCDVARILHATASVKVLSECTLPGRREVIGFSRAVETASSWIAGQRVEDCRLTALNPPVGLDQAYIAFATFTFEKVLDYSSTFKELIHQFTHLPAPSIPACFSSELEFSEQDVAIQMEISLWSENEGMQLSFQDSRGEGNGPKAILAVSVQFDGVQLETRWQFEDGTVSGSSGTEHALVQGSPISSAVFAREPLQFVIAVLR